MNEAERETLASLLAVVAAQGSALASQCAALEGLETRLRQTNFAIHTLHLRIQLTEVGVAAQEWFDGTAPRAQH